MRLMLGLIDQRWRCPLTLHCTRTQSWTTWRWVEMGYDQILKKNVNSHIHYAFLDTKYSKTYQHVSTWDVNIFCILTDS